MYSGQEVIDMLDIVCEEADSSIEMSFNEGYKLGRFEFEPEAVYWKKIAEEKQERKFLNILTSVSLGFIVGAIATSLYMCIPN